MNVGAIKRSCAIAKEAEIASAFPGAGRLRQDENSHTEQGGRQFEPSCPYRELSPCHLSLETSSHVLRKIKVNRFEEYASEVLRRAWFPS